MECKVTVLILLAVYLVTADIWLSEAAPPSRSDKNEKRQGYRSRERSGSRSGSLSRGRQDFSSSSPEEREHSSSVVRERKKPPKQERQRSTSRSAREMAKEKGSGRNAAPTNEGKEPTEKRDRAKKKRAKSKGSKKRNNSASSRSSISNLFNKSSSSTTNSRFSDRSEGSRSERHRRSSSRGHRKSGSRSRHHKSRSKSKSRSGSGGRSRSAAGKDAKGRSVSVGPGFRGKPKAEKQLNHDYDKELACKGGKQTVKLGDMDEFSGERGNYLRANHYFAHGGQGYVYLAYSFAHKKCVALKVVHLSAVDSDFKKSAMTEFNVINMLMAKNEKRKHKFQKIIEFYENFMESNKIYTIMELGVSDLDNYFKDTVMPLADKKPAEYLRNIDHIVYLLLEGLIELHSAGVMHLDFKLQNAIMIPVDPGNADSPKQVKLIDFGGARTTSSDQKLTDISQSISLDETKVFTQKYAPPELLLADQVSIKSDMWSLGAVMVEMLTRKELHVNEQFFIRNRRVIRIRGSDFAGYLYKRKMPKFSQLLTHGGYVDEHNETLWLMTLACLHPEQERRPMAYQLAAFMKGCCLLSASSQYAVVARDSAYSFGEEGKGSSSSSRRKMPKCSEYTEKDYYNAVCKI